MVANKITLPIQWNCFGANPKSFVHASAKNKHITPHASHLTPHTSNITHHTSQITHHTSHITHHTSNITHHTSHITHHTSPMHTSHITHAHMHPCTHAPTYTRGQAAVIKTLRAYTVNPHIVQSPRVQTHVSASNCYIIPLIFATIFTHTPPFNHVLSTTGCARFNPHRPASVCSLDKV